MRVKTNIYIPIILIAVTLLGCSKRRASIAALCELDTRNDYVLKWEIYPEPGNTASMDVFSSDNDSVFPATATKIVKAEDYTTAIKDSIKSKRLFFKLKTDNTVSGVITNRFFNLDSIHNFRDVGGYFTNDGYQIRWGKIFRSGTFSRMTKRDESEIDKLGIRTILDMRSADSKKEFPRSFLETKNYVRIPIGHDGFEFISSKIIEDRFFRGDAIIFTQDNYRDFVDDYTEQYASFFDYLTDEANYPIVFNCYLGKDQSGMATYLLLKALDVPTETAEEDYMLSNVGVKKALFTHWADDLSESKQEVVVMMSNTDLAYLRYGLSCIRKKYGSVDDYITNELRMTPDRRSKLRQILLYKEPQK